MCVCFVHAGRLLTDHVDHIQVTVQLDSVHNYQIESIQNLYILVVLLLAVQVVEKRAEMHRLE